jgi:hypothetical protein
MGDFEDLLQNGARPGKATHHFYAAFLALPLIGEQPGKIFDLFDIILHHNLLELP